MTSLEAVLSSKSPAEVNERSLTRAHELWQESGTKSFAILSVGAGVLSTERVEKELKLQALLRDMNFASVRLVVHVDDAVDRATFIFGVPLRLAERLRQRFEQNWFLFSGTETDGEVVRFTAEGPVEKLGVFDPVRIASMFSRPGHEAVLEWRASGFVENLTAEMARRSGNLNEYPYPYSEIRGRSVARVSGQLGLNRLS